MKTKSIIILFFVSNLILAQTASKLFKDAVDRNYLINCELKYNYQNCNGMEMGINFTKPRPTKNFNLTEFGLYFSNEYKFLNDRNIIAPKIGLGFNKLYFKLKDFGYNAKLNVVIYNPKYKKDLRFLPEIGITYLGIINLNYGYSIPLSINKINEISNHTISIGINYGYWRSLLNFMHAIDFQI